MVKKRRNSVITKINEIYLTKLNNAEYTNFMDRTRDEVALATVEKIGISQENLASLEENIAKMQNLVAKSRVSDLTAKLAKLDAERDDIVVYIMAEIANKMRSPLANICEVSTSLYNATKQYVGIQKNPEQQESQQINGLLLDLAKPEHASKVTALGLNEVIAELKRCNDEFIALTSDRTHEKTTTAIENSKEVRANTDPVYEHIITMAFVTSVANPTTEATTFVSNMNALIDETMTRYNQRTAKK